MTTRYRTAADAIERSISHDEIVHLDYDADIHADLIVACDDWTDGLYETEYWADAEGSDGTDGEMAWRVHLRHPVTVQDVDAE
ncbi:MAG: hypothetical protein NUW22_05145 [Acidobacteria bacterium]|nr:hypothetical protein [Acidobacteriota bacterium]